MSRFSPADLDDIKARNPLADIAGGYVKLRRLGTSEIRSAYGSSAHARSAAAVPARSVSKFRRAVRAGSARYVRTAAMLFASCSWSRAAISSPR